MFGTTDSSAVLARTITDATARTAPVEQRIDAGVDLSFRIGQRVRHRDYKGRRVTGVVRSLCVDSEQGLMVSIALDAPIVIEAGESRPIDIWNQTAPAHEFAPFDERDELIGRLLDAANAAWHCIAELSPTQARVEVAQLLQSAIEEAARSAP